MSIPSLIPAGAPGTVTVPVRFQRGQSGVAALAFTLNYDPACLVPAVAEGAGPEQAVTLLAPPQFRGSVLQAVDTSGSRLSIVVADYAPPLSTLPDLDPLLAITFDVICTPAAGQTIISPLTFSSQFPASFSNTLGRGIPGTVTGGSVAVTRAQPTAPPTSSPTPDPSVTPEPVNTAPTARDDTATTSEFRPAQIEVLANDVDPDGDPLSVMEVTQGGFGRVTLLGNGRVLYAPDPGRSGLDLFSYTISDGRGGLSEAFVRVTVTEFNVPPAAQDDRAETTRNVPVIIDVLANDSDIDPVPGVPALTVFVVGQPDHGTTQLLPNDHILFTPTLEFVGETAFGYSIVDSEGASGVAQVTVRVRAVNRPPRIDLPTETLAYTPGSEVTLGVLATDPDGDTNLLYTATGLPPGLTLDPKTGQITGTLDKDAHGEYPVAVVVSDGQSSATIEFTLTISPAARGLLHSYLPLLLQMD